jgi:hypothetical protein
VVVAVVVCLRVLVATEVTVEVWVLRRVVLLVTVTG